MPRWNGSTGATTDGDSNRSVTSHRLGLKQCIFANRASQPGRLDPSSLRDFRGDSTVALGPCTLHIFVTIGFGASVTRIHPAPPPVARPNAATAGNRAHGACRPVKHPVDRRPFAVPVDDTLGWPTLTAPHRGDAPLWQPTPQPFNAPPPPNGVAPLACPHCDYQSIL